MTPETLTCLRALIGVNRDPHSRTSIGISYMDTAFDMRGNTAITGFKELVAEGIAEEVSDSENHARDRFWTLSEALR